MGARQLYDFQSDAIQRVRGAIASGKKRPLLQLATGLGKTVVASEIIDFALQKKKRVLFMAPAVALIDQTRDSFIAHGMSPWEIGVMQADHPETDPSRPVQVATIQTLSRRIKPDADLVIIDECHQQFRSIVDWLKSPVMQDVPVVGLSATPWAKGMGKVWDEFIIGGTTQWAIDNGFLSDFRVFAPSHPDLSGVKVKMGEYDEDQLAKVMSDSQIVADVVSTWCDKAHGLPTLCFAVNRLHAEHLQKKFQDVGVVCGYIDAYTTKEERRYIQREFERGRMQVVCNVGVLTTGVDWDVRCIILARPTKSEMLFVQIVGRGIRKIWADGFDTSTKEGRLAAIAAGPKRDGCLILDHSDTTLRLGFVTDIHHEQLNQGQKAPPVDRGPRLPKECPKCAYLKPVGVSECPSCGHKPEKPPLEITQADGALSEISRGTGKKDSGPPNTVKIGGEWVPLGEFYAMLKHIAFERGYSDGWASNQYKTKVGTWPNYYKGVAMKEPSFAVFSWVKSRQIAWAKKRQKESANAVGA